ncbi:MAG TPA: hypothetical protein VF432_03005 [Thermoanaerobaculia bacterium]
MKLGRMLLVVAIAFSFQACRTADTTAERPALEQATVDSLMAGADYSLGYCNVALNAPAPCVEYRGKAASGVAPGCQHDNCTTAKANARANLLTGIPPACGAYIQCNDPCRCIQKSSAGTVVDSPK